MIRYLLSTGTLVGGLLLAISLANSWRPTRPLQRWWRRSGELARWYVASAPATFIYLAILAVTSWVLIGMPAPLRAMYITAQSTNLQHLMDTPLRVLVRSAFFVTNTELLAWIVLFAMLLAPAERWLGSARTIAAFGIGHVLATGGAALDVWIHIRYLHGPSSLWNVQDTGASYGFAALAALLSYRLRGWSRTVLVILLALVVIYGSIEGTGFTARGHAIAVLVGLCLYPITRTERVRSRQGPGRGIIDLWRRSTADGEGRGPSPAPSSPEPSSPEPSTTRPSSTEPSATDPSSTERATGSSSV